MERHRIERRRIHGEGSVQDVGFRPFVFNLAERLQLAGGGSTTRKVFDSAPRVIAHDRHPEYLSTKYAQEQPLGSRLIPIQHHHTHIASAMGEHGITERVIGAGVDGERES